MDQLVNALVSRPQLAVVGTAQVLAALRATRRELLLVVPPGVGALVEMAGLRWLRGRPEVRIRLHVPSQEDDPVPDWATGLTGGQVELLRVPDWTPRMAVVDGSVLVLSRNGRDYAGGALLGRDLPLTPLLVHSLAAAGTAEPRPSPAEEALDPQLDEVLHELTLGTKDETAARKLGVPLRTYRRRVAGLMRELDAQSRFQAGYLAARRQLR
ncbi:hypothetical protein ACIA8O_06645 [Kitasatospora sp. NPDC051853]|uniref:hypothetical protein n=1 Tax=Kitasatospora sp. NPDC051853 TaxID=3364058 RepID=UPI00378FBF3B